MTPLKIALAFFGLLFSLISMAASRQTVELTNEVDLLVKSSSGDLVVVEELAPETILRFRTDTKTGDYFRHILILSSPNLSSSEVNRLNQKRLFLEEGIFEKSKAYVNEGASFDARTGRYQISSQAQREALVDKIIEINAFKIIDELSLSPHRMELATARDVSFSKRVENKHIGRTAARSRIDVQVFDKLRLQPGGPPSLDIDGKPFRTLWRERKLQL